MNIFKKFNKNLDEDKEAKSKPKRNQRKPRKPKFFEAVLTFVILIVFMAVGIAYYEADPHIPMLMGVMAAALMALYLGYSWKSIEDAMVEGISKAMQAIIILAIIGVLIGVWIISGVVPTMIYYGLKVISPSIFLVSALIICSITSLATGTSWGTLGTMGVAIIGIAGGLGIPVEIAAGAAISGAYFGDKLSPLSETTNLAPAMAGTDVFSHIKFMLKSTLFVYVITFLIYLFLGFKYSNLGGANIKEIDALMKGISGAYTVSPWLLIPPIVVIVVIGLKVPAIPGITIGILLAGIMMPFFQSGNFGNILNAACNGVVAHTGNKNLDALLSKGGLMSMMYSISLTLIAMMFGGIVEETKQLEVIVDRLVKFAKTPAALVNLTQLTCIASNATMPEQYISIVIPGRMYEKVYKKMGLAPVTLSNALESAGTVTSALIPYNTCGVYITGVLGVTTLSYLPYAFFNLLMPITVGILVWFGFFIKYSDSEKDGSKKERAKKEMAEEFLKKEKEESILERKLP